MAGSRLKEDLRVSPIVFESWHLPAPGKVGSPYRRKRRLLRVTID